MFMFPDKGSFVWRFLIHLMSNFYCPWLTSHIAGKVNVSFVLPMLTSSSPLLARRRYSGFPIVVKLVTVVELLDEINGGLLSRLRTLFVSCCQVNVNCSG